MPLGVVYIIPDLVLLKGGFREQEHRRIDKQFHDHMNHISHYTERYPAKCKNEIVMWRKPLKILVSR